MTVRAQRAIWSENKDDPPLKLIEEYDFEERNGES